MTKSEAIEKMNRRNGTTHTDYFMMLVSLRQRAERLERSALRTNIYSDLAKFARADHNEALGADEDNTNPRDLSSMSQEERSAWFEHSEAIQDRFEKTP